MPVQFEFRSIENKVSRTNAERLYRLKQNQWDHVQWSGRIVSVDDSEIDIVQTLAELELIESADSIEIHLWNDSKPDVVIDTQQLISEKLTPDTHTNRDDYNEIQKWLHAFRSGKNSRKRAIQSINQHPGDLPNSVGILTTELIDGLNDDYLTNVAGLALERIAEQHPCAVQEYVDQLNSLAESDHALISRQATQILNQLEEVSEIRDSNEGYDQSEYEDKITEESTQLQQATEPEPQLTDDDEVQYRKGPRRTRDDTFKRLVRDAYERRCAICGSARESPDGNPEVDAAHIYPKKEDGSDDVRNGLALCNALLNGRRRRYNLSYIPL